MHVYYDLTAFDIHNRKTGPLPNGGEEQVPIPHLILKLFFMYLNLEAYKEKIKTVISWQAKLGLSQCAEDDKRVLLEELASDNWSFSIN